MGNAIVVPIEADLLAMVGTVIAVMTGVAAMTGLVVTTEVLEMIEVLATVIMTDHVMRVQEATVTDHETIDPVMVVIEVSTAQEIMEATGARMDHETVGAILDLEIMGGTVILMGHENL